MQPHELDMYAREAAINYFIEGVEDDRELTEQLIAFQGGFSFHNNEARLTVWEVDETLLIVLAEADRDEAHHTVFAYADGLGV